MKTFGNICALVAGGLAITTLFQPSASSFGYAMLITSSLLWLVSLGIFIAVAWKEKQ